MGCCPHASPDTSEGAKRGHVDLTGSQNPEQCSSDLGLESHFCVGFVLHNTGAAERKAVRSRAPVRGACGAVAQLPAGPGPEGCPGSVAEQPSPGDSSHQSPRQPRACQRSPWAERRAGSQPGCLAGEQGGGRQLARPPAPACGQGWDYQPPIRAKPWRSSFRGCGGEGPGGKGCVAVAERKQGSLELLKKELFPSWRSSSAVCGQQVIQARILNELSLKIGQ